MDDLISRQAALDALDRIGSLDTEADKKYARSVFEALPSAERRGRWIEPEEELEPDFQLFDMTDLKGAICSECGYEVGLDIYVWNYCPYCNAKMDEVIE